MEVRRMRQPILGLLTPSELALFVDYYELTSGKADFDHRNKALVTEEYFIRQVPFGVYLIAAGLEQLVAYVLELHFEEKDLGWLEATSVPDFRDGFLDFLKSFRFTGDIHAVPEGTVMFPNEPIVSVTAPTIEAQIIETYLLNIMNFQTLIATKTARMVDMAKGRTVVDFGPRRAHGRDAALLAARAAYIAGATGSSLVIAGKTWGIPYIGTIPHKFVQDRPKELQAFREYAESFPHNTILLVDTYDTLEGVRNACIIGRELQARGTRLQGVRLDSGDLLTLSKATRELLNHAGLKDVKVFVSSDLDEYRIEELLAAGAPIDGFGVGTRLVTGANYDPLTGQGGPSAMPGVYKLVERTSAEGRAIPKTKLSTDKELPPFRKQVYRHVDAKGRFRSDTVARWNEKVGGAQPLLAPIVKQGRLVYDFPLLSESRTYCLDQLSRLGEEFRRLRKAPAYPVQWSTQIVREQQKLRAKLLKPDRSNKKS
jgi:nicotinate phosphoribosyltransferase